MERPGAGAAVAEPSVPAVLAKDPHQCWRWPAVMQRYTETGAYEHHKV